MRFLEHAIHEEPISTATELPDHVWGGNHHVSSVLEKLCQKKKKRRLMLPAPHPTRPMAEPVAHTDPPHAAPGLWKTNDTWTSDP